MIKKLIAKCVAFSFIICVLLSTFPSLQAQSINVTQFSKANIPETFHPLAIVELENSVSLDENYITIIAPESVQSLSSSDNLPRAVDNSKLKYFPPVGDQGLDGTCVQFATSYYNYTYMNAKAKDLDVKEKKYSAIISVNNRLSDLLHAVLQNGNLYWNEDPFGEYIGIYRDPGYYKSFIEISDWKKALANRPLGYLVIKEMNTLEDINLLKKYLSEQYIFSFGSNTDGWRISKIKDNANSALDDEHVGKNIIIYNAEEKSNHEMVLVGYNDDVWVDINCNGIIESSELGAFKFANSWGPYWEDSGFSWFSYDSVLKTSQVKDVVLHNRHQFMDGGEWSLLTFIGRENYYTPRLLGELHLNSAVYGPETEIGWAKSGSSDVHYKPFYAMSRAYEHSGDLLIDFSDFLDEYDFDFNKYKYDFYIKMSRSSHPYSISDFELTDGDGTILASSKSEIHYEGYPMSFDFSFADENGQNIPYEMLPFIDSTKAKEAVTIKVSYGALGLPAGYNYISWITNGGINEPSQHMVPDGGDIVAPEGVIRDGYDIAGWYLSKDLSGEPVEFPIKDVQNDIYLYAKWIRHYDVTYIVPDMDDRGAAIDLGAETLVLPASYTPVCYSVDGYKWIKGGPPNSLSKLLDKRLILRLADKYDAIDRKPADDATIIQFPIIEARPRANPDKLMINYAILADSSGITNGAWTLAKNNATTATIDGYEFALSDDKKNPNGGVWSSFPKEGVAVAPYSKSKSTYLVRSAPVVSGNNYIPASKVFKVTPLCAQKAPIYKADYNKETIKPRAGSVIFGGSLASIETCDSIAISAESFDIGQFYIMQKTDRSGVSITKFLDNNEYICMWIPATAKKPASEKREYKLAARSNIETQTIQGINGAIRLPNTLQVWNNNRWGALPKFTQSIVLTSSVRVKSTARATGTDDSSQCAASKPVDLAVEYGVYTPEDARTPKSSVLSVTIGNTELAKTD